MKIGEAVYINNDKYIVTDVLSGEPLDPFGVVDVSESEHMFKRYGFYDEINDDGVKGCTCDSKKHTQHACPFKEQINDESLCDCCDECTSQCAGDI